MNATKERYGKSELKGLFRGGSKVVVAKGKKVLSFDLKKGVTGEIADVVLGPTGNLRAPAIRAGKTWYVGFNEEMLAERFG